MSDPRTEVESLTYRHSLSSDARQFPPGYCQVVHFDDFHCVIDAERLIAMPTRPFHSPEAAMSDLEPHLRSWELRSGLFQNIPLRFEKTGHVVTSREEGTVNLGSAVAAGVSFGEAKAVVTMSRIDVPEGPPLNVTEEVQRLSARWLDVTAKRERLLVGAYWVYTEVQRFYGSRDAAAEELKISRRALSTLGKLTDRNDPEHGRKARKEPSPLSTEEVAWIRALIPRLILRVAEAESEIEDMLQITMEDLPPLPNRAT